MKITSIKEAIDKINVLKQNQIHLYSDVNKIFDHFNQDNEGFFKFVEDKWSKYEHNELFPQDKTFDNVSLKDILDEAKESEDYLTEKEVLNSHLFNIEEILTELKKQKELRKYDELKEIYDLLNNYWRKL